MLVCRLVLLVDHSEAPGFLSLLFGKPVQSSVAEQVTAGL